MRQLMESECSKHVKFLLCASMFPLCSEDVPRPVPACKSFCETVKTECSLDPVLVSLWPKFLNCETLPEPDKHGLCMQVPQSQNQLHQNVVRPYWPWTAWKFTTGPLSFKPAISLETCPQNFTLANERCIPLCSTDSFYTSAQKKFAESWILILAAICFILTLFSLVTFWAETTRFGFPERPVLFLTLCYNLLSICYLERIIFHDSQKEAVEDLFDGKTCGLNPQCLASYITTSYLTLSAATWWLIFALCWYLSTAKQWSSEALERKSGMFHVFAWVPPLFPPIGSLLWGVVKPNELTGLCTAPGFTEIPAFILLTAGAILTILAAKSLRSLRSSWQFDKLSQVMSRMLLFGSVFFIPAVLAIILSFFEELAPTLNPCLPGDTCHFVTPKSSIITLARLFVILAGGSLTGMWVWSRKTCNSCRSRISHTSSTPTTTKLTNSFAIKKTKIAAPLYAGIQFQRAPISAPNSRV